MTATDAFDNRLQQLCLHNFPAGLGAWRQDFASLKDLKKSKLKETKLNINHHSSVTLKEYGAGFERTEALSEYVAAKKSPWLMDYSWSGEARSLRELAVKSPWMIDDTFIVKYFKTLRLLDQQIYHIDPRMRQLANLEELTLSANFIKTVSSDNLPPKLRVLELCANCIDDLESLTTQPPPLEHLGIGRNNISNIYDFVSGVHWPHLLSLDLSNNHLCDLLEVVSSLATVPRLRCLVLNGNPLALVPGYRGYVIDSMRKLLILDDTRITSDEKHYFRGLARRRDNISEENIVTLSVEHIRNLPVPDEIKNSGEYPEYPVIVRKYMLQFWYPHANIQEPTPRETAEPDADQEEEKQAEFQGKAAASPEKEFETKVKELDILVQEKEGIELQPIRSSAEVYSADGLELKWSRNVACDRLREMRDFFGRVGMQFDVIEEKSLLYPPDELPTEESLKPQSGHKKGKKEDKSKAEPAKKDDKSAKKKKKLDEAQMVTYSIEYNLLSSFYMNTASFLEGEFDVEGCLSTEGPVLTPPPSPEPQDDNAKDKKKADKKSAKDKGAQKSVKSGKSGKKDETVVEEEEAPPPPLQVKVAFRMHHWRSVKDCPVTVDI